MRPLVLTALLVALGTASPAAAQGSGVEQVEGAEAAYDEGVRAFEAGSFAAAGAAFERADELLPARVAMENAIRAYREAGDLRRAATVATALAERDAGSRRQARFVPRVAREAYKVTLRCDASCEMMVDGQEERYRTVFLAPNQGHVFRATFDTGLVEMASTGSPGEDRALVFERPPEAVVAIEPMRGPAQDEPEEDRGVSVIPVWVTLAMMGATAGMAGVAIWSGIDTNNAKAAYDSNPTLPGYEDGLEREARTNILIGVAAGTLGVTLLMAIFTDWSFGGETEAEDDDEGAGAMTFGVGPMNDGFHASVSGRLP
ncbi:MAG: hypothetical protein JRH11_27730 [Deltaproteobacteria bacterium]|nr:hypothetical protein [Deltaproteobacteria bacterium]